MPNRIWVGCAGWSIPKLYQEQFPPGKSHLERYAQRFPAVEINSSFYRPHRPATYARWASAVPQDFRFAVKVPRQVTHLSRLGDLASMERFLGETSALGDKLGPLLVQLPPGLPFEAQRVNAFFEWVRVRFSGGVACEPRHPSWFTPAVERLLVELEVARVAADPAPAPQAARPGGWPGLVYYRLHGSPQMYYSAYSQESLDMMERLLREAAGSAETWCIFDNTAEDAATANALDLLARLQ